MPQYLYLLKPTRLAMLTRSTPLERPLRFSERGYEDETVSNHFAYLKDLTDQGVMILVGRTTNDDETTFGIAIFEAENEAAAVEIMQNDPAVKGGVMTATLFPYRVALMRDFRQTQTSEVFKTSEV